MKGKIMARDAKLLFESSEWNFATLARAYEAI